MTIRCSSIPFEVMKRLERRRKLSKLPQNIRDKITSNNAAAVIGIVSFPEVLEVAVIGPRKNKVNLESLGEYSLHIHNVSKVTFANVLKSLDFSFPSFRILRLWELFDGSRAALLRAVSHIFEFLRCGLSENSLN